ncbi:lipid-A-disaccharide kinase [Hasllibacter halocynthiae]|uniref:Tetraacyldisaccharide 4'-kinase n=1 Tax=Hasllibacter halocynthiae TaxID=595589 RepID=A0A2T0X1K3_9RHOB|nr:tetraacyldisaccharide 4'-kinase [Hasllibacter halocynthiae]PRY92797.1 lipid-A-disaccharide kinase [Hasllibacter halocynthiae]
MKAPGFWSRGGRLPAFLSPLGALYAAATARRVARGGRRLGVPVVCVGNLSVGGTGKTPVVMSLIERVKALGLEPQVVSRGYGGTLEGPVWVDPARHDASEAGDEPLLMAPFAPVWVAKDRGAGAEAAEAAGAETIILDDGFQSADPARDLQIVVIDAEAGFGNGRVFPAGPLREPVAAGLARADLVVLIGPEHARKAFRQANVLPKPVVDAELAPLETGMDWTGIRVLAFAGIGRPAKFFATLRGLGAEIVEAVPLGDHQPLPLPLLRRLTERAARLDARLVCTEKDAVRLPPGARASILVVPVRLRAPDWSALDDALARILPPRDAGS